MTTGRQNGLAKTAAKKILRFAPNFSVFLLRPDAVCLYSEDRKFFLHGELYCALADAIGQDGKTLRQLVGGLAQKFAAEKISEAVQRLIERRFVRPNSSAAAGVMSAYWASLGLSPESAAKNLQHCPVSIRSIDVDGAKEFAAGLGELGVRITKRSGALTVALVNDYLDDRLAALNRRHVTDRKAWLIVQPSGVFPLVGPVFSPGQGPCWSCLAERMKRNREVKALLDRAPAQAVAVSPLARSPVGRSGIELAAIEIAKAIASGFRTELRDHIVSLDLLGATTAKHYVAKRPQCPACGSETLRDPQRPPVPLKLGSGGKCVMTSGGYRTVSPGTTVAHLRKHVSPLTGVISRLEPIASDLPLNTSYFAAHNFSPPAKTVDALRSGIGGGSFGKGSTVEQGEASALMEAMERCSGIFQGDEIRMTRRLADFSRGNAIHPNEVLLFSDAQYRAALTPSPGMPPVPPAFNPAAETEWSPVWSLRDARFKYLPTGMLYFAYPQDAAYVADSNGCAAGNTLEEAIVQGFLELVERDAYAIWWYNRLRRPQVDLKVFEDSYVRDLQNAFAETGRMLWVLDVTSDFEIPSFVAVTHWMDKGRENIEFGSGAHFDARVALLRALTELNQFLSIGVAGGRRTDKLGRGGTGPFRLHDHAFLRPKKMALVQWHSGAKFGRIDTKAQLARCVGIAKRMGFDFLVLDQTRPDIGVPVVRVIVPGLRHFYRRFAPGRLYDVPVRLGLRSRPLSEDELNPLHPPT